MMQRIPPCAGSSQFYECHIAKNNYCSCLFHTFKILLYRPMFAGGSRPKEWRSDIMQKSLVACVSSAMSIITIFDLFCRTFGSNYSILSLSYSVYIAASIFLLQVQADPDDKQALQRLGFCIQALEQAKSMAPSESCPHSPPSHADSSISPACFLVTQYCARP